MIPVAVHPEAIVAATSPTWVAAKTKGERCSPFQFLLFASL